MICPECQRQIVTPAMAYRYGGVQYCSIGCREKGRLRGEAEREESTPP